MRAVRLKKGLLPAQVAEKVGCSRSHIANIEAGRRRIPLHDVPAIAKALGIPVRDLLPADWTKAKR